MSNETGLDWLARNVHVWNESAYAAMCGGVERVLWISGAAYGQKAEFKNAVTKDQWLARRAELQNKPSWKDAPEWAEWLTQDSPDSDGCAVWWWFELSPEKGRDEWTTGSSTNRVETSNQRGEVLGDWRDTLESRPEELKPSIEEANMLSQEFKPFTSIEDNQEQDMAQQQEVKQDNGWFERGELPPVGVECDIRHSCWNSEKYEKVTVAAITNEYVIVKYATFEQHYMLKDISFRPIRTEREVLISVIIDEMNRYDTDAKLADAILEAGFRLGVK